MMKSSYSFALVALFGSLATIGPTTARTGKTSKVFSFRGGSSPDGLRHGQRGLACLRELLGNAFNDMEATDDELSAAIFMAYGKEGIDRVCGFNNNRRLREEGKATAKTSNNEEGQRRREASCSGQEAVYPSAETTGSGSVFLPDESNMGTRTDPTKMIQQAQLVLDDALEAEYNANLCESWFGAFTDVISIVDLVFVKQGSILDGINRLSCGLAQGVARGTQNQMRTMMISGMKHDLLINQAELHATYMNMESYMGSMCSVSARLAALNEELTAVKDMLAAREYNATRA